MMKKLYLNSYQSYIWNGLASDYVRKVRRLPGGLQESVGETLTAPGAGLEDAFETEGVAELLRRDGISLAAFQPPIVGYFLHSFARPLLRKPDNVHWEWLDGHNDEPMLQVQFRLPPGTYATCAIRELGRRSLESVFDTSGHT